jgi:tRNA dimethylallyltransferase
VDQMMNAGLVNEVKSLLPYKHLNALQTVGYAELIDFLEGKIVLQKAVEEIKIHTRQYAKRQMTWFKKDRDMQWFSSGNMSLIFEYLNSRFV